VLSLNNKYGMLIFGIGWFVLSAVVTALFAIVVTYGKRREQEAWRRRFAMQAFRRQTSRKEAAVDMGGIHVVAQESPEDSKLRRRG
jgi:hypothetical protein